MRKNTQANPKWLHFGPGNICRAFLAAAQQKLLNTGKAKTGIIARVPTNSEVINKVFAPHDNLFVASTLHKDAIENEVVASISEALDPGDKERLIEVFTAPSLQIASFTITEKAYSVTNSAGGILPFIAADMNAAPDKAASFIGEVTRLCFERFRAGAFPLALVSMDNCAKNCDKLKYAVCTVAEAWQSRGFVSDKFIEYLNSDKIAFPYTMIDKITPVPSQEVAEHLAALGCEGMEIIHTERGGSLAPFVNAEETEYLVIEDKFPNGRPPLEEAGIIFADRATVNRVEKMKVGACLNPLHSALAIFGCLLGYKYIYEVMRDDAVVALISQIGYREALPRVPNPGILDPEAFLKQVIETRLPNPRIPDTVHRIAMDTSQKIPVRYGEVLKKMTGGEIEALVGFPLFFAGWLRYLLCVDDFGKAFAPSPDPLLEELRAALEGIILGDSGGFTERLRPILSNKSIFGADLFESGLAEKTEHFFADMTAGPGAVRRTLIEQLTRKEGRQYAGVEKAI
jgi:fructuronate reductase